MASKFIRTSRWGVLFIVLGAWIAQAAAASEIQSVASPMSAGGEAFGVSLFVGPPSGDPFQIIEGYDGGVIYTDTGSAIQVSPQGIVLRRNGIYQVHVEGVLFFNENDATAPDDAAAVFSLLLNGEEWVSCFTPANGTLPVLPALFRPETRLAKCLATFTLQVRGRESNFDALPFTFGRGATVQVAMTPNDRPLGEQTLMLTRIEVSRQGR